MIAVTVNLALDERELQERFVRASGPGGQNVNKVSTAVELRFDAAASPSLPEAVRRRALRLAGRRATAEGVIVILAQRYRTQEANRRDAEARLVDLLARAAEPPPPLRKKTWPTLASKVRRLEAKSRRGAIKSGRGRPGSED